MTEALAQTVLQMGMTVKVSFPTDGYDIVTQLRGTHFSITANSVMRFIRRQYTYDVAPF